MIWFLLLHISALLFWSAALLYLPTLIIQEALPQGSVADSETSTAMEAETDTVDSRARFIYTRIATPAALLAIVAGTLVFLPGYSIDIWLLAKLTLVTGLVVCHVLVGLMVLRAEGGKNVELWCRLLTFIICLLMLAILWLVLSKPSQEDLLWLL